MDKTLWEPKEIEQDRIYSLHAGGRSIFAGYTGGEWRIASSFDRGRPDIRGWEEIGGFHDTAGTAGEGMESNWTRIVAPDRRNELRATPAMPDKPLVIRPEDSIFLPEEGKGLFFLEIPLWVRVTGSGKGESEREILLAELPTAEMSKTWFGNPSLGELCYVRRTRASREIPYPETEGTAEKSAAAVCPVMVRNSSSSHLEFGRFCLRTEFLSIYGGERRLWTSSVELDYRGKEETAQNTGTGAPEQLEGKGVLLAPPRAVPDNNLVRKSFSLLKDLTGW